MLLIGGSILAVTLFPYNRLGELWNRPHPESTGVNLIPKYAQPFWVNWFRLDKLPETITLDSSNGSAQKKVRTDSSGMPRETITFTFNNNSSEFPQDVTLYFDAKYDKKTAFCSFYLDHPDGRIYHISGTSLTIPGAIPCQPNQDIYYLNPKRIANGIRGFQPAG